MLLAKLGLQLYLDLPKKAWFCLVLTGLTPKPFLASSLGLPLDSQMTNQCLLYPLNNERVYLVKSIEIEDVLSRMEGPHPQPKVPSIYSS